MADEVILTPAASYVPVDKNSAKDKPEYKPSAVDKPDKVDHLNEIEQLARGLHQQPSRAQDVSEKIVVHVAALQDRAKAQT